MKFKIGDYVRHDDEHTVDLWSGIGVVLAVHDDVYRVELLQARHPKATENVGEAATFEGYQLSAYFALDTDGYPVPPSPVDVC